MIDLNSHPMNFRLFRCYPEFGWLILSILISWPVTLILPNTPDFVLTLRGFAIFLLPGLALVILLQTQGEWWERMALGFLASLAVPGAIAQSTIFLHTDLEYYYVGFVALTALLMAAVVAQAVLRHPPLPSNDVSIGQPLWLKLIFAVMLVLLLAFHLNAPLDGDHWDATAYIQNIRHDPHILSGDPKFNAGLRLSPRFDFSAWLVDQALMSYISGVDPVDQFVILRLPLLLIAIGAFYRFSKTLTNRPDTAMLTTAVWIGYLITSNFGSVAGYELLVRPDLDKVVAGFIVLPLTLAAVVELFQKPQRVTWIWLLICSVAAALTHPIAAVLIGLSLIWFGIVELWTQRSWNTFRRLTFTALILAIALVSPVYSIYQAATIDVSEEAVMAATSITDTRDPSMSRRLRGTLDLQRFWILDDGTYILHPRLLLQPIHLPVLVGLPLLFWRQRRSRSARLLFGMVAVVSLLLLLPPTASILGRFTTPWLFYRLHWPISMAAVLVLGWALWAILWRVGQARVRAVLGITGWLLALIMAYPFIRTSFNFLHERKYSQTDSFCTWADDILRPFQQLAATDTMVLADPAINICLISYAPYAGVMEWRTVNVVRNYIAAGREAEGWQRLWDAQYYANSEFIDARILSIINQWQIQFLVIKLDSALEPQLRHMPELFQSVTTAAGYRIYKIMPAASSSQTSLCTQTDDLCSLIRANSLYTNHQWLQAIEAYQELEFAKDEQIRYLAAIGLGRSYQQAGMPDAALVAWQNAQEIMAGEAQPLALQGALYALQLEWKQARESYHKAIQRSPTQSLLHARIGDVYYAIGQSEVAESYYHNAAVLTSRPHSFDYYLFLGQQWLNVGANERAVLSLRQAYDLYKDEDAAVALGQVYQAARRWDDAIDLYRAISLQDPWEESGHLGLGQVHRAAGDYTEAIREYRHALQLHPLATKGYQELATILKEQQGLPEAIGQLQSLVGYRLGFGDALLATANLQAQVGTFDAALTDIQRAIVWDRMDAKYYLADASYASILGNTSEAIAGNRKVLEFSQGNPDAYLGLAQVALNAGELAAGEGYAMAASMTSHTISAPHLVLAGIREARADPTGALMHLQRATELSANAWATLGSFHLRQGAFESAAASLQTALEVTTGSTTAYQTLASVYMSQAQVAQAEEILTRAITLYPGEAANYVQLAVAKQQAGESDAAIEDLRQAIRANPGNVAAYTVLGSLYQQQGLNAQAEQIYNQLIKQTPMFADGYVALGHFLEQNGKFANATQTYEDAIATVSPSRSGGAHLALATLQQRQGESERALLHYQAALTQQPVLMEGYLALSQFHLQRGQFEAATNVLEKGLEIAPGSSNLRKVLIGVLSTTQNQEWVVESYNTILATSPGSIDTMISLANYKLDIGQPQQALDEIKRAQEIWAGSQELLTQRTRLELAVGDLQSAAITAQQLITVAPGNVASWLLLGMVHATMAQFDDAEAAFRQATNIAPGSSEAWLGLATLLTQRGRSEAAIEAVEQAIVLDQSAPAPHLLLAQIHQQMGSRDAALDSYETAQKLNVNQAPTLVGIGLIHEVVGELELAEAYMIDAIKAAPTDPSPYKALSAMYQHQQRFDLANDILVQATDVQPVSCQSYENLGNFLTARGEWDQAESTYRKALQMSGCRASLYRALGTLYHIRGTLDYARQAYQRAITAAPGDSASYIALGRLYQSQDQASEALLQYLRATEVAPSSTEAYLALGESYQEQAQWANAEQAYQQAIDLAPTLALPYIKLGDLYQLRGRSEEAYAQYRQATLAAPTSAEAYVALGMWHQTQGQWEDAERAYLEAISVAPTSPAAQSQLEQFYQLRYLSGTGEAVSGQARITATRNRETKPV